MSCSPPSSSACNIPILLEPSLGAAEREVLLGAAQVLESIDEAATITLPDRRFIYVNPAFESLYGFSPATMLGRIDLPLHTRLVSDQLIEAIYAGTQQGGWQGSLENRNIKDQRFEILLKTRALRTASGLLAGCLGLARPVCWQRFHGSLDLSEISPDIQKATRIVDAETFASLSARELEVLQCYGRHLNTKEIAEKMKVSVPTVFTYRARIIRKLKVPNPARFYLVASQALGYGPHAGGV